MFLSPWSSGEKGDAEQVSFLVPEHSVIMTTISKHSNVKTFTEKLLLLLNRGGECVCVCVALLHAWQGVHKDPWGYMAMLLQGRMSGVQVAEELSAQAVCAAAW